MLEFLKNWDKTVELIPSTNISNIKQIPDTWKNIFSNELKEEKVTQVINLWKQHIGEELKKTIQFLDEHLYDVHLIKRQNRYAILYVLQIEEDEYLYYEGGNPNDSTLAPNYNDDMKNMPNSIQNFYQFLHNGFYHFCNRGMGIQPIEYIHFMEIDDDDEDLWNLQYEDDNDEIEFDEEEMLSFYWNSVGFALSIDKQDGDINNSILWKRSSSPECGYHFWKTVDQVLFLF